MPRSLDIYVGSTAAERIDKSGWHPSLFDTMIGASGGPKWLILSELDQVLAESLLSDREKPITLLGSSIGTWRHACLSQSDPIKAIQRLQKGYLYQSYTHQKPSAEEVSRISEDMLKNALGQLGPYNIVNHPTLFNAIVTARAKTVVSGGSKAPLIFGMGLATIANAINRDFLRYFFQRVTFCHAQLNSAPFSAGFESIYIPISEKNVISALKASSAIPLLMDYERSIIGAPPGPYWDGGIIDYHFTLDAQVTSGLVLYPHFCNQLTPGWFDKKIWWRNSELPSLQNLVLLCPNELFLNSLPYRKIPDRGDFQTMSPEERIRYWEVCVMESQRLAEDFHLLISSDNPLDGVTVLT